MSTFFLSLYCLLVACITSNAREISSGWSLPDDKPPNDRIVGGVKANVNFRLGLAHIYMYIPSQKLSIGLCTGTIIGKRWVLSAAHCFVNLDGVKGDGIGKLGVIPSTEWATMREARSQGIFVKTVWVHNRWKGHNFNFDIAVLELVSEIPSGRYKKVILSNPPQDKSKVVAVGYGNVNEDREEARFAMMTYVVYRRFDWCKKHEKVQPENISGKRMICAVSKNWPKGETDTCYGDSGGPLYLKVSGNKLYQFGITSFSFTGCAATEGIPWYVRISQYKWELDQVMKKKSKVFRSFSGDLTSL